MFYNLKLTFRNLRRNGLYSAINIIGLTVSLASCILITLWVYDELSYDRFHSNKENIYRINSFMNNERFFTESPPALSVYAKSEMPEVKEFCRISNYSTNYFQYNDRKILNDNNTQGVSVDSTFFNMFSFTLLEGNIRKPFDDDFSIILSESMCKAIFGDENPMGKAIKTGFRSEYFHVTGVMKDMPGNSSLKYDYLVPFSLLQREYSNAGWLRIDEDFGQFNYSTYLELHPGTSVKKVEEKLKEIEIRGLQSFAARTGFSGEMPPVAFSLQQLEKQYLYNPDGSPGGMAKVRLFSIISILILMIACINYVNLVTARVGKRNKEMGIRKFLGAKKKNIIQQSMQETCLLLFISTVLATILIYILLPFYNLISGKDMEFHIFALPTLVIYGITFISVLGLAGIYPALYVASFGSGKTLQNKNKHVVFRKILVVTQFACSIILVISTLVITLQMNYLREKNLGYDKENIICFLSWDMKNHFDAVKGELQKNPDISGVATASFNNMITQNFQYGVLWPGKETEIKFTTGYIDSDFLKVMNIQLLDGQIPPESSGKEYCFLNETAIRQMGIKDPLSNRITLPAEESSQISGIVKDFNFESLEKSVSPLILFYTKEHHNAFYVKTTARGTKSALASIEKLWKEYSPNLLFQYTFLDENFGRLYQADIRMGKLLYAFAFIAILISCLGLFGLITYTAEVKTKEIGIRKVLGASISNIVNMLSREFLLLVSVSMCIAFPSAYYWLDKMLQDYAYRISISWWMFALAGLATVVLMLLTVGWQAIRAATANPVKSIKTE